MNNKTAEYKQNTDFNIKHSDIKDASVCGDVKNNQQLVLILHFSSGVRLYTLYGRRNEHIFHHKPDTRQIPRVCGSLQEHQQCLGKEEKPREEREDTKHTHKRLQSMIKNYHRSLSYGVLQKERERDRG